MLQVNHHFDYELDGHSRKYVLHCVSTNNTNYEVYLVREMDGFKIPYGKVHGEYGFFIKVIKICLLS